MQWLKRDGVVSSRSADFTLWDTKDNFFRENQTSLKESNTIKEIIQHPDNETDTIINNKPPSDSAERNVVVPLAKESVSLLSSMLESEDCESGIINPSEKYFRMLFSQDRYNALNVLSKIFMDCFQLEKGKSNKLIGILHILSHNAYEDVYPMGQCMAIAALSYRDDEVAEFGIKCFENWEHPDGIEKLKAVRFSTMWLQSYADDVIKELTEGD